MSQMELVATVSDRGILAFDHWSTGHEKDVACTNYWTNVMLLVNFRKDGVWTASAAAGRVDLMRSGDVCLMSLIDRRACTTSNLFC